MNNLTYFNYSYICMYKTLYTCIDKYNFNFSKMETDTKLKISTYTNISTSYPKIYQTLMKLKIL